MACAGIDFGNKKSVVAIARRGGIDIVCNDVSNRATPTMVTFTGEQRYIGEMAANQAGQYARSSVSGIQRLLGVDPTTEFGKDEASRLTCPVIAHPSGAGAAVEVSYNAGEESDSPSTFSFQALAAMFFTKLMEYASTEYKAPLSDCVISVPGFYTESQRRAVVDAARIANINVQRVINENAALALSYGIFRTNELPDSDPIKVAFVDMGEASTSVTVAAFTRSRCDILSSAFDPSLGGRNFDDLLVDKFRTQWKQQYNIDAFAKPRYRLRIYKECEKVKRTLSANAEAFINLECFMNDIDVSGRIKRDELESLAEPLLARLRAVCEKAIADANLANDEKLFSVEIVGGSMRIPCVKHVVSDTFTPAPMRTTLNMDECIARGCALQSAMLSPAFKVRDYKVGDVSYFDLKAEKIFTNAKGNVESMDLISKFDDNMPCLKAISFKPKGRLTLNVKYADTGALTQGNSSEVVASYDIDAPEDTEGRVKAKIRLNANGIVELADVSHHKEVEEFEEVKVKVPKKRKEVPPNVEANGTENDTKMADAEAPSNATSDATTNGDTPMDDKPADETKTDGKAETKADGQAETKAEGNAANKTEDKAAEPEMETITEMRLVKKMKVMPIPYTLVSGPGSCLTEDEVKEAIEKEVKMRAADLYIKERNEAMNKVESFVYDARARISDDGDLADYSPADVRAKLKEELDGVESWLYSDEGENANKSAFTRKHTDLVANLTPILLRKKEFEERPVLINLLNATIESYKKVAVPNEEKYAHLNDVQKETVLKCCEAAALWLKSEAAKQQGMAKDVDPMLTVAMLKAKREEVENICRPIEQTPKPKPKEEEKKEEKEGDDATMTDNVEKGTKGAEETPKEGADAEKMEVDGEEAGKK